MTSNAIVPRATVEDIVRKRNHAIGLYDEALRHIIAADEAVKAAHKAANDASPGVNSFNYNSADEVKAFREAVRLPDTSQYMRVARRLVDIDVWSWIIQQTKLESYMDAEAKEQLRRQMAYVPERFDYGTKALINGDEIARGMPEVTVENVVATLQAFSTDAEMIWRRGIANAFAKLDRRFRSHDGFKIGGRVVLTYAFDEWGSLRYGGTVADTLIDIERVFSILDGKADGSFTSAVNELREQRRGLGGPRQSLLEMPYFRIRGFKNGNAHLWFTRDDLVRKVNKVLAEHYGEVIGDGNEAEEDVLKSRKLTPARNFGFFPTPDAAAETMLRDFPITARRKDPVLRVLEPSAGTGHLARRCADLRWRYKEWSSGLERAKEDYWLANHVECVEIQPALAQGLQDQRLYARVYNQDFLTLSPGTTRLYDRVVMNPPFDRERDIDHVTHAMEFLKDDGYLTAIMSAGTQFRESRKALAFRALMEKLGATWRDLPAGSFAETGTYVNTVVVTFRKDGKGRRW